MPPPSTGNPKRRATFRVPLRILHVVQRYHPAIGGAETHAREVAEEQARRGHAVTVATTAFPGAPAEEVVGGVRVVRFPTRRFRGDYLVPPWLPMAGAREFLRREAPDVLHAHSYRFDTVEAAADASRATSVPLVVTAHGFYPPENALVAVARRAYDARRGRRALSQASRCVAVTRHEVAHYEALGVAGARVDVVPNGIPASALAPGDGKRFRESHGLGSGPLVLFLARLAHDKGLPDLVRAMARVPGATLAVCGRDAGARAESERTARRLGLSDRVRFLGPVAEPRHAYAACDLFVLPSHYEAFGIVLLEAMAQGRPVIATTAGGMPEVVDDAGAVVPPRDPDALAEGIRRVLSDPEASRAMGERGRERARSFLWPAVVDRLQETYERARRE